LKESSDETTGISLTGTEFTEIEYALQATASATGGALYCFRLTDAGTATDFTYTEAKYGQVVLEGVNNFLVEAAGGGNIGTQNAGTPFNIQITARDFLNNIATSFDGAGNTVDITSTGTLSAGSGTTAVFTNGVLSSHSVTISNTGSFTITATDSAGGLGTGTETGTSNLFTVNSGALGNFLVEAFGGGNIGTQMATVPFNIRITARDANNNTVTSFDGVGNTVEITSTGTLSAGSGTTATFTNGVLTSHSVTISNTGSWTITATKTSGSENGISNSFTVNVATVDLQQVHYRWRNDDGAESGNTPPWWDTNYGYRQEVTITAGTTTVPSGYSVSFTEDTATLITNSKLRSDGNDWRVVYWNGTSWVELDRWVDDIIDDGWNSANTTTWFKTQASITASTSDNNYYVYYGYAGQTLSPPASMSDSMGADVASKVFLYADDFEEHAASTDPDGWTDHGTDDFKVMLQGSEKWLQAQTRVLWDDGTTASGMANVGDAVWSSKLFYHQAGTSGWGGIGVHTGNGGVGYIVLVYDGNWYRADENWGNATGWTANANIHFPVGTKGRIEVVTSGTTLDAYWYNPAGYSPEKVTLFTGFTITAGTGKLDLYVERPMTGNDRWTDGDDFIVREYVSPEPTTSSPTEETPAASATWAANEDTELTGLLKLTTKRLRLEISSAGAASGSVPYRLQVSQANPTTCDDGGNSWTRIDSSSEWNMVTSTHFADGDPSINISDGLTDANTTFVAGQLKESSDETAGITLGISEFTEIEYALQATASAVNGATYCFRLTDAGVTTDFTYTETKYGKVTLGGPDLQQLHYRWRNDDGGEGKAWWNASYAYRQQITITAGSAAVPNGYSVSTSFNHAGLVTASKSQADGDDIRVLYWSGVSWIELDRALDSGSSWDNASTKIWFKSQAAIAAVGSDNNYYLYYGNTGAVTPPADKANIFLFSDDFEAGNLNKWTVVSGLWQVATDQSRSGTYAVKYPAEADSNERMNANPALDEADVYVDAWWRFSDVASSDFSQAFRRSADSLSSYETNLEVAAGWNIAKEISGTWSELLANAGTPAANTWTRMGTAIDGTGMRVFKDGTQILPASGSFDVGTELASGNIGFKKWSVGAGEAWWIDDVVARKYVDPEPTTGLGSESGGISHNETLTGNGAATNTVTVSNVGSGSAQLYLAAVAIYNTDTAVSSISGGGLTWTLQKRQCAARLAQPWVEVWQAFGSPSSSFTATVTLDAVADRVSAAVSRYSGADPTTPTEGADGSNTEGQGVAAVCNTGTDTLTMSLSLTSSRDNSVFYVASHPRNTTLGTPDADYTERAFISNTSGGDGANLYVHDRTLATTGPDTITHTLGAIKPWDMAGLVINPASSGSGATWAAGEDTPLAGLSKHTTKRLRLEISNAADASGSVPYRLQVSQANPATCDDGGNTWTRVDTSTHWNMVASTNFADADATENISDGLTDPGGKTFVAGQLKESTDETAGITLGTEFTEIEYALTAANAAIGGATYCFRLTDAGNAADFTYTETKYGKVTLGADLMFGYRKPITIDRTKISDPSCAATLTNFPILYSVTDANLATIANGGNVADPEGDDIVFRALDDATCAPGSAPCGLDHEIEKYDPTTGELVAWVRIPTLNTNAAASDTVIYVYYGNSDVATSSQNVSGVWDANYAGVWHLDEAPANGVAGHDDSTGNPNDGTPQAFNGAAGSTTNAAGKFGVADEFDGTDDYLTTGTTGLSASAGTVEVWANMDTFPPLNTTEYMFSHKSNPTANRIYIYALNDAGTNKWGTGMGDSYQLDTGSTLIADTWYHFVITWDGTSVRGYKDGSLDFGPTGYSNLTAIESGAWIGSWDGTSEFIDGTLDELRVSDSARGACWIDGQFKNQNAPGDIGAPNFYTVGTEDPSPLTFADVTTFTAEMASEGGVRLQWRTSDEVNNLGFHLYREENGQRVRVTPEMVAGSALFAGAGTRLTSGHSYGWWDRQGRASDQYWLEDVDLDGTRSWNGPVSPTAGSQEQGSEGEVQLLQSMMLSQLPRGEPLKTVLLTSGPQKPQAATALDLPELPQQFTLAAAAAVKLEIRETGWYRVAQPDLVVAGLDAAVNPKYLQLFVEGQEQALVVRGESDESFDSGDAIEFYGQGVDTAWTDAQVYWLVVGAELGQRAPALMPAWAGTPEPTSFAYTLEQRERTIYVAALRNGEEGNFYGPVVSATPVDQVIDVHHWDGIQDAQLEVTLQGLLDDAHQVKVLFNGVELGTADYFAWENDTTNFTVSAGDLVEGDNTVTLVAEGGASDISLIDVLRLTYAHTYTVDSDSLEFTVEGQGALGQPLTIDGFTNALIQVADVTDPMQTQLLDVVVQQEAVGYSMTVGVPGAGTRTLLALTDDQIKSPAAVVANEVSSWHEDAGAEVVMIAYGDFVASVEPLKALRESQGYSVALVAVEDLYDEFAFGAKTPWAIRDFLEKANSDWQTAPRFVVLVGDASSDPRDYMAFGQSDFVPTWMVETDVLETASDDWFVDFDLDGVPELAIGRLPVRTVAETDAAIAKILAYEADPGGAWQQQALMVADQNDQDFDFEQISASVKASLPDGFTVEEIFRGQSGAATKEALLAKLNEGSALVNYSGHGSTEIWGGDILTSQDAKDLSNGSQLPFFVALNCLNGFFHDIYTESLAEALIRSEQGGAIGVWASSALTGSLGQSQVAREMYRLVFDEGLSLGQAAAQAKAVVSDLDVRRSWVFFGDPVTRIDVPAAAEEGSSGGGSGEEGSGEGGSGGGSSGGSGGSSGGSGGSSGGGGGGGGGFVANDPPTATDDSVATKPNVAITIDVLGNDEDPDGDTLSLVWVTASTSGSVVINPDQTVTYTPDSDFNGDDSFLYLVGDGKGGTDTATVSIAVTNDSLTESTVLVANFINGNNRFLASRVYLWNPSSSVGNVTVRVFTLGREGASALLGTLDLGTLEASTSRSIKVAEDILEPLEIPLPYTDNGGNLTLEFSIDVAQVQGTAQVFNRSLTMSLGTYPLQAIPVSLSEGPTVLVANFTNGNNAFLASRVYLWNPSLSGGKVTARVFTLGREGASALLGTADLGTLEATSARNIKVAEDILAPLGIPLPYTENGGNLTLEFTIQASGVRGTAQVFDNPLRLAFGTYPLQEVPVAPSEGPTVLLANWVNGNNKFLASRIYLWNPSTSAGKVTARVFTLGTGGSSSLLGTVNLGTLEALSARNIKVAEDILTPLESFEIPMPYTHDGGNLTVELTIGAGGVRGDVQVFNNSQTLAFGTYPLQEIPSALGTSPTILLGSWLNGNDASSASRIYLWNPSASAGRVTARLFTLESEGASSLLGTVDLGTLGASSGRNIKLAEDILAPLGMAQNYTDDEGNLTVELTIDAPGVRGATQVFDRGVTLAFGTYPMQVIECDCEEEE
jgi:hypothetical protein